MAVSGPQAAVVKTAGQYRAGRAAVDVRYDPASPGPAAPDNPAGMTWLTGRHGVAHFAHSCGVRRARYAYPRCVRAGAWDVS